MRAARRNGPEPISFVSGGSSKAMQVGMCEWGCVSGDVQVGMCEWWQLGERACCELVVNSLLALLLLPASALLTLLLLPGCRTILWLCSLL